MDFDSRRWYHPANIVCILFVFILIIFMFGIAFGNYQKSDETLILPIDCTMDILSIGKSNNGDWIVSYVTRDGKIKAVQYGHGQTFSTEFIIPEYKSK